jgi:hypothetical protein
MIWYVSPHVLRADGKPPVNFDYFCDRRFTIISFVIDIFQLKNRQLTNSHEKNAKLTGGFRSLRTTWIYLKFYFRNLQDPSPK